VHDFANLNLSGQVIGNTSRGVFVLLANQRVVFFSLEAFRGPLTINLLNAQTILPALEKHSPVLFSNSEGELPSLNKRFKWNHSNLYSPGLPDAKPALPGKRKTYLVQLLSALGPIENNEGIGVMLPFLINQVPLPLNTPWSEPVATMIRALQTASTDAILSAATRMIGQGRGLTPSGDDLICGMLLALRRWNEPTGSTFRAGFINQLFTSLVDLAFRATTSLSATILEAACMGLADERLTQLVDALMTTAPPPTQAAQWARGYGASSGLDALTGMIIVERAMLP